MVCGSTPNICDPNNDNEIYARNAVFNYNKDFDDGFNVVNPDWYGNLYAQSDNGYRVGAILNLHTHISDTQFNLPPSNNSETFMQ